MIVNSRRWTCQFLVVMTLVLSSTYDSSYISAQSNDIEICNNAIDDNGDGFIDLNDNDCICTVIEPVSAIPNPSFEDMNCCPNNRSQLNCADVWIQASEPTTDYLHNCGWSGWDNFPPPLPFPDGEAIMGFRDGRNFQSAPENNWKEYAGACLLSPLKASERYRFEFYIGFVDFIKSPAIDITFFGTSDCINLPFGEGQDDFGCPTNGPNWVELGSRRVSSNGGPSWVLTSIDVVPRNDITAIAIGPSCNPTSSSESTYYFFDNLVLDDIRSFEFVITEVNHPCSEDFSLMIPEEPGLIYQWYKDGIALIDEVGTQLSQMYGEGSYQVRTTTTDGSCSLTKEYIYTIPIINNTEQINLCEGDQYIFGTQTITDSGRFLETLKNVNNCDSNVVLDVNVLPLDGGEINVKIFEGEEYNIGSQALKTEGQHIAQLSSILGCDSLVTINLDYYHVYMPNIFSPNSVSGNDRFMVSGGRDLIEITSLVVFDRWGQQVFADNNLLSKESDGWNGRHKNEDVQPGVYLYVAKVVMDDGVERMFKGDLMVLF